MLCLTIFLLKEKLNMIHSNAMFDDLSFKEIIEYDQEQCCIKKLNTIQNSD